MFIYDENVFLLSDIAITVSWLDDDDNDDDDDEDFCHAMLCQLCLCYYAVSVHLSVCHYRSWYSNHSSFSTPYDNNNNNNNNNKQTLQNAQITENCH